MPLPNIKNIVWTAVQSAGVQWVSSLTDWLKRASITINGAKKTADFTDPMSTTGNWTKTGTGVTVDDGAAGKAHWNAVASTSTDRVHQAIGETLGNTFVVDWDFDPTSQSGNNHYGMISLTAGTSEPFASSQDAIICRYTVNTTAGSRDTSVQVKDGASSLVVVAQKDNNSALDGKLYYRLIRDNDKLIYTTYYDSDRTEVAFTLSGTFTETITGLNTIIIGSTPNAAGGSLTAELDNVSIYNNTTVVENIPSQQTATSTDDFSTDNTTETDTEGRISVTGGVWQIQVPRTSTNSIASIDLGALSDNGFVVRSKVDITALSTPTTDNLWLWFGISDKDGSNATSVTRDSLGVRMVRGTASTTVSASTGNGVTLGGSTHQDFSDWSLAVDTIWVEFIRHSQTLYSVSFYSDSTYSANSLIEREVMTISSAYTGLRYFTIGQLDVGTDGTFTVQFDDIEAWNNITEVNPSTLTDYPIPIKITGNTNLQRKTAESYNSDLSSATGYTTSDSVRIDVDTTDEEIDIDASDTATDNSVMYYDLTSVNDTKWTLDVDYETLTLTAGADNTPNAVWIGIGDNTSNFNTSQDSIALYLRYASATNDAQFRDTNGAVPRLTAGTTISGYTNQKRQLFIRLQRLSSTKAKVILYADKARTIELHSAENTVDSATQTLRYLKIGTQNEDGTGDSTHTAKITKIRFWDNTTNPVNQETATYDIDFTEYADQTAFDNAWVSSDTAQMRGNPTNDNVDLTFDRDGGANDEIYYDMGLLDNSKFVIRYKMNFTDVSGIAYFAISSVNGGFGASGDHLGWRYDGGADLLVRGFYADGTDDNSGTYSSDTSFNLSTTDYWIELSRTSGTSFTVKWFSDSNYSILLDSKTMTIPSTIKDLRYLVFHNHNGSSALDVVGTLDDVQIWNGISSPNASARKFVFTDNVLDDTATEYSSETISYDPINGDYYGYVRIPSLTTGADTTIQMYYDYTPSANPSYVPDDSTVTLVQGADNTLTQDTSSDTAGIDWSQADSGGAGLQVNSGHVLVGKRISAITVYMKYTTSNSSPAQNMVCKHFGSTPATIRSTATETPSSSTLTTSYQSYTYNFANPVNIQAGDHIMVVGDTDGGSGAWHFDIEGADGDANINFTTWTDNGASFTEQTGRELRYSITYHQAGNREQSTWDSNHKAVYHLSGNSIDSTVYGNDGTETSVDWEERNNDVGLQTNDTGYITCGGAVADWKFLNNGGFTFETWLYPNTTNDNEIIFDSSDASSFNTGVMIRFETGGLLKVAIFGTTDTTLSTGTIWTANELQHLGVIYDGTTCKIYRNGIEVASGALTSNDANPTYVPRIGWSANGNDNKYDGYISKVLTSDTSRPSSHAITTYNAEKSDTDMITVGTEESQ